MTHTHQHPLPSTHPPPPQLPTHPPPAHQHTQQNHHPHSQEQAGYRERLNVQEGLVWEEEEERGN